MAEALLYAGVKDLPIDHGLIEHIMNKDVNKFEAYRNLNLISFDLLDTDDTSKELDNLTICQTREALYFICENPSTIDKVQTCIRSGYGQKDELLTFFSLLLKGDIDVIDDLEERINDVEDTILTESSIDYDIIVSFRKELFSFKKYYDQLAQVFDGVLENENKFFTKEELRDFKVLDQKNSRLIQDVRNLRDYITQLREAYQAQIDIEQNQLMKLFTVVTSVFLPLTFIAGWYGMNLRIPEVNWRYGYPFVIILSIIVVIILLILFKKKKWF